MRYDLLDKPDFGMVRVAFEQPGEQMIVESQAMVARDGGVEMKTQMQGGLMAAAKRKVLGGESLFQNTFTATAPGQSLWLAPNAEGDVVALDMNGTYEVMLNSGAFLGSVPSVTLDTKWGGAKGFFSGTGFFLLKCAGHGPLFFASYGGIHAVDVGPQGYICDTSHVVGFTSGLNYTVTKVGGLKSLFLSGEGLVCNFQGQGRLWDVYAERKLVGGVRAPVSKGSEKQLIRIVLALLFASTSLHVASAQAVLRDLAHIVATGGVAGELAIPVCQDTTLEHGELAHRALLQRSPSAIHVDTGGLLARYGVARFAADRDVGALVELVRGLGYHTLSFGETDLGDPRRLLLARARALREAGVPYLATNLRCDESAAEVCETLMTGAEGVPMMRRGDSRVAILSYLQPSALQRVGPDRAQGLRLEPLSESIRNGVRAARAAGADVVVAIVDAGYGADAVARTMTATEPLDDEDKPDVALVGGAGTQLVFARPSSFRPAIAAAPTRSASDVHVRHNGTTFDILVRPSDDAESVHPAFERFVERIGPAYCEALGQDLPGGRLDGERDDIDAAQLTTLVGDVMRESAIADVAVMNHSAIDERWSLRGSDALTESDINIGVQYDEPLMVATVPATWLRNLARAQNESLMTRGLEITNAFASTEKIKVNSRLLDLEANYRVVTIRFLAECGDHGLLPTGVEWEQLEGQTLRSVMRDYLEEPRDTDPRDVPDPGDRLEWTFRINTDATFAGSAVRDPGGYAEGPLQNANQVQLGLNAIVGLNALSRRAAWENLITGNITGAATSESNGFDEGADQIVYRTSGNYRGFRADNDELYVPDLVIEGLLRTEFTKQQERDRHFLNMRFTAGLQWRLHLKVKVKLLGGFEILEAADDELRSVEPGLGAQLIIDPWVLMREGLRKLTLATTVDYFASGLGDRNRHLLQGLFDLQFNLNRYFALALNVTLYGLKEADNDFSFAAQTTAGIRIGWVGRRVQR